MRRHHLGGDQPRRRPARNQCRGDDDVHVAGLLGIQVGRPLVVVLRHLLGITGRGDLDIGRLHRQVLPTQRPHLVGNLGPRVGRPHDRTHAPRGADRSQTRDPDPRDQHLGRRHLARGSHLTGEEPAEHVSSLNHRPVAGDVGHRGQHIQRLGTRDPRHRIHRQRRDRTPRQILDQLRVQTRGQDADHRGALTKTVQLLTRRRIDTEHDIRGQRVADRRAHLDVRRVREARRHSRTRIDNHLVAQGAQLRHRRRRRRHPRLTSLAFLQDPDNQCDLRLVFSGPAPGVQSRRRTQACPSPRRTSYDAEIRDGPHGPCWRRSLRNPNGFS